MKMMTLNSS